jgi:adenosylcobinamide-phosphate synthase
MMVGRNTEILEDKGVIRATVESVAENFTDGIASPVFFASLGWLVAGWPGAAAFVVFYRLSNTLDSMWGKLNERYRRFGTFAARLDDVLNYVPARLAWIAVAVSAAPIGLNAFKALVVGFRDSGKHESPNSAWTEAAFSGALGIQLGGAATYGDRTVEHPLIGEALREPDSDDISRSVRLLIASSLTFAAFCAGLAALASCVVNK